MDQPPPRLIVVEDEADIRTDLAEFFTLYGYEVREAEDGRALDRLLTEREADLVILDVMLPGESGVEIAHRLRKQYDMAILMLTCRGESADQIQGLEAGADAYLTKGTDLLVIEATVKSLLRRTQKTTAPAAAMWRLNPLSWILTNPAGRSCKLSSMEKILLQRLGQTPGEAVERTILVRLLGKEDSVANRRNLDVLMLRLRNKILQETGQELPIEASYGRGLVFNAVLLEE